MYLYLCCREKKSDLTVNIQEERERITCKFPETFGSAKKRRIDLEKKSRDTFIIHELYC